MKQEGKKILHRLAIVRGQIDGIRNMISAEADCKEILTQWKAVQRAFSSAGVELLEEYLDRCAHQKKLNNPEVIEVIRQFSRL